MTILRKPLLTPSDRFTFSRLAARAALSCFFRGLRFKFLLQFCDRCVHFDDRGARITHALSAGTKALAGEDIHDVVELTAKFLHCFCLHRPSSSIVSVRFLVNLLDFELAPNPLLEQ